MNKLSTTPFSILDLAPLRDDDQGPAPALKRSLALAQHAERLSEKRDGFIFCLPTAVLYRSAERGVQRWAMPVAVAHPTAGEPLVCP